MREIKMKKYAIKNKEYEMILKRTSPGRLAAKRQGKLGGRPKKLDLEKIKLAQKLYANSKNTVKSICKTLNISKPTFYAYLWDRHKKPI